MNLTVTINGTGITHPGMPLHKASFCPRHGNHRLREFSASQGQVSFATFLCLPKKSRNKSALPIMIVSVRPVALLFSSRKSPPRTCLQPPIRKDSISFEPIEINMVFRSGKCYKVLSDDSPPTGTGGGNARKPLLNTLMITTTIEWRHIENREPGFNS